MSLALAKRAVEYTVQQLNRTSPPPAHMWTALDLLKWMKRMGSDASDSFRAYPVLYLPPDYDIEEEAVIQQTGQHRGAALLQLFSQKSDYTGYTKKLFNPETVPVRVDIVMHNC